MPREPSERNHGRPGNPFEGLTLTQIYTALTSGGDQFPHWPDEKMQKGYAGTSGVDLLRRAFTFIEMLEEDNAFRSAGKNQLWKGLDYGCGWGRFASVMLTKGTPEQFDLCDAWPVTLRIIRDLGYKNKIFQVPELLKEGDIAPNAYDFTLSFSVFTHLSKKAFEQNIPVLINGLKPGGKLYVTVRHEEFIGHKYAARQQELQKLLRTDGIVFLESGGDIGSGSDKVFGDTMVTKEFMSSFGDAHYLGQPHSLQHVYSITRPLA
jgi:hypothetical protein